ncbi:MAG TPA: glycosyltransferase [Gemmatimonadales bacterium]|nr:glycosyltransferase [Gemmatimonadales bacterium]
MLTAGGSEPAPDPLSVAHILAPGSIGGLERVVQQLALGQHHERLRVQVVAVLDAGDAGAAFLAPLEVAGVAVTPLRLAPRAYLSERRRLRALLELRRPDLVHTHGYRADVQGGSIARRLRIPTITTVHGFTGGGWKNRMYEHLQLGAFRRCDAVVAVSAPLIIKLEAFGIARDRLHLVPNAAPTDEPAHPRAEARRRLGLPPHGFVVGWVGRLSVEKGPDVFLRALAALGNPAVLGVLIGAGREREPLGALGVRLGMQDRLVFPGTVAEAGRLFPAFDCFVLSSRTEGTPIVLFEAMAAEVPVVATAVGGVPDVVSPAEALMVPPDDPAALAAAIAAVLADPGGARARAREARRRLDEERNLAPWLARYDAVYRLVMSRSRPRTA